MKARKTRYDMAIEGKAPVEDDARNMTADEKYRTKQNANFASTTDRFASTAYKTTRSFGTTGNMTMDTTRLANNTSSPDVQVTAKDIVQYDLKDTRTSWAKRHRATDYEIFTGKKIGFDNTQPRFNFDQVFFG